MVCGIGKGSQNFVESVKRAVGKEVELAKYVAKKIDSFIFYDVCGAPTSKLSAKVQSREAERKMEFHQNFPQYTR